MPVPILTHSTASNSVHDNRKDTLPPLPKIYSEDRRINRPEEYFRFANPSRYQYLRLLGHGAYGMVW